MKTPLAGFVAPSLEWQPKFPFDLVIAYEDDATRHHAMRLYGCLAQQLRDDHDFQCAWWKFAHLRDATLMERATDDAVEANMIILSLDAAQGLTAWARAWIEAWVPNKIGTKSALVALVHPAPNPRPGGATLASQLRQYARQAQMDFFLHSENADREEDLYSLEAVHRRARTVTPILEDILHMPTHHLMRAT